MRIFGGQMVENLMDRFGLEDDVPLESGLVSKAIENAQKRVEGHNFDIRKQLVEYDDVMNKHREIGYTVRRRLLEGGEATEAWLLERLAACSEGAGKLWSERKKEFGEVWLKVAQQLSLQTFDLLWLEHIDTMDHLRRSIGLEGYGGRDPLVEYKKEARFLFERLMNTIWATVADRLERVRIKKGEAIPTERRGRSLAAGSHGTAGQTVNRGGRKIGRNDPCPCGSGKKYKKCCYPKFS